MKKVSQHFSEAKEAKKLLRNRSLYETFKANWLANLFSKRDEFRSVTGLDVGEIETECDFLRRQFSTTSTSLEKKKNTTTWNERKK